MEEYTFHYGTLLLEVPGTRCPQCPSTYLMHNLMKNVWYENCEPWITGLPA